MTSLSIALNTHNQYFH